MATQNLPQNPTPSNGQPGNYLWIEKKVAEYRRCQTKYPRLADTFQSQIDLYQNWLDELTGSPSFLKETDLTERIAAPELRIFHLENKLARAYPARRPYWTRQLFAAWRSLVRQQRGEQ